MHGLVFVCLYFRLKENNIPHNFINLFKIQIMETIIILANAKKSQSEQRIFKAFDISFKTSKKRKALMTLNL